MDDKNLKTYLAAHLVVEFEYLTIELVQYISFTDPRPTLRSKTASSLILQKSLSLSLSLCLSLSLSLSE